MEAEIKFKTQEPDCFPLEMNKTVIPLPNEIDLKQNCSEFLQAAFRILGKEEKEEVKEEKHISRDKDKVFLEGQFQAGVKDFNYLSQNTKFSRQQVRNMWLKFSSNKSIFEDFRNQRKKLDESHCSFILKFFSQPENFDKTIFQLHYELKSYFNLSEDYISYWTLYKYVHSLSLSYKNITYKVNRANIPSVKLQRLQIAKTIITAHLNSFDFIYIDEISFNLELRPSKGWGLKGYTINASKPPKSKNYSAIIAMDIQGYLGLKIVKGGVKGPEFISFMCELVELETARFSKKKTILFMDNASIHKSKDFMQKFAKYYNILYNAPYTPQLNPIEFSFSKLKYLVKKAKPISETDLVKKILEASQTISPQNCSEFIVNSLKFIEKALNNEDFF